MYKILLVDDDLNILHGYRRNLRSRFDLHIAEGAVNGFLKLKEIEDFAVIISDYNMPKMNGLDFLIWSKEFQPDAVRIMLTGNATVNMLERAINEGDIYKILMKPCSHSDLVNTLESAVRMHRKIISEKEILSKTLLGTIKIVTDILASVNPLAFNKAAFFNNLAQGIMNRLNKPYTWEYEAACLLSQIGCVTIPYDIFIKHDRGEELTVSEAELMRTHPLTGASILRNIPRMERIARSIEKQHDSYEDCEKDFLTSLLQLLNDYYELLEEGKSEIESLELLSSNGRNYEKSILFALEAEVRGAEKGKIYKDVSVNEMKIGMELAEDLYDARNFLLLPKGVKISDVVLFQIRNHAKMGGIKEPIKVLTNAEMQEVA